MKRRYLIVILCYLTMLFVPTVFGESNNKDLHIEEFGTTIGEPIDSGFVFYDGRYIDAPYVVSQKGLGIFINDVMIRLPIKWPRPDLTQDVDPGFPKGITRDSTEKDIAEHSSMKYRYLTQHYPKEEAVQKLVEYYRNLPCIKEVEIVDGVFKKVESGIPEFGFIKLTYFADKPLYVQIHSFPDTGQKFDKASVSQGLEESKKYFEERLKNNICYFFSTSNKAGELSFITDELELLQAVQILRSKKSVETKIKEMRQTWGLSDDETLTEIITNFSASSQLEKRLYKEIKSRKEKVYTPQDLQKNKEKDSE